MLSRKPSSFLLTFYGPRHVKVKIERHEFERALLQLA